MALVDADFGTTKQSPKPPAPPPPPDIAGDIGITGGTSGTTFAPGISTPPASPPAPSPVSASAQTPAPGWAPSFSDQQWWENIDLGPKLSLSSLLPTTYTTVGYTTPNPADYIGSDYLSESAFEFLVDPNNVVTAPGPPVNAGVDTYTSTELFNTVYDSISKALLDADEPVTIDVARNYALEMRARGMGEFVTRIAEDLDYLSGLSGIPREELEADPELFATTLNNVRRAAEETMSLEDIETQAQKLYTLVTTTASVISDEIVRTGGTDIIKQVKLDSMSADKRDRYLTLEKEKQDAEYWIDIYERNMAAKGEESDLLPSMIDVDAEQLAFYRQQYANAAFEQERLLRETPININKAAAYVQAIKVERELNKRAQEIVEYLIANDDVYQRLKETDRRYRDIAVTALDHTYMQDSTGSMASWNLPAQAQNYAEFINLVDAINRKNELERPLAEVFANEAYAEMARKAPFAFLLNQFRHIPLGDLANAFSIPPDYLEFVGRKYNIDASERAIEEIAPWEFQERLETWYAPFSTPLEKITDRVSEGLQAVGIPEPVANVGAQFTVMAPFFAAAVVGGPPGWAILAGATASYATLQTIPMLEEYGLTSRQGAIAIADLASNVAIFSPTLNSIEDAVVRSVIESVGTGGARSALTAYGAAAATRAGINVAEDAAITGTILAIAGIPVGSEEWNRVMGYTLLQSASFGAAIPATGIFMRSGIAPLAAYAMFYSAARYEFGLDEEEARYIGLGAATAVAVGSHSHVISRAIEDIDLKSRISAAAAGTTPGFLKDAALKVADTLRALDPSPIASVFAVPARAAKTAVSAAISAPEVVARKVNELTDIVHDYFVKSVEDVTVKDGNIQRLHSWRYDLPEHKALATIEFYHRTAEHLFPRPSVVRTGTQIVNILDEALQTSGNPYAAAAFAYSPLRAMLVFAKDTVFTKERFDEAIMLTSGIPIVEQRVRETSALLNAGKNIVIRAPVFGEIPTSINTDGAPKYELRMPRQNMHMTILSVGASIDYRLGPNGNVAVISTEGIKYEMLEQYKSLFAETIIRNAAIEQGRNGEPPFVNSTIVISNNDLMRDALLTAVKKAGVTPSRDEQGNYVIKLAEADGTLTKDGARIISMDSSLQADELPHALDYSDFLIRYRGLPRELMESEMRAISAAIVGAVLDHFIEDDSDSSDWDDLKRWMIYGFAFGAVGTVGKLLRYQSLARLLSNQPDFRTGAVTEVQQDLFVPGDVLSFADRLSGMLAELLAGKHRKPHYLVSDAARTYRKFIVDRLQTVENYYQARAAAVIKDHGYSISEDGALMRDGMAIVVPTMPRATAAVPDEVSEMFNEFFVHAPGKALTLSDAAAILPVLQYHAKYMNNTEMADLMALVEDVYEIIRPIVNDLKHFGLIEEDVTRRDIITLNKGLLEKSKLELSDGLYIPRGRTYEITQSGTLIESTDPYFISNYSNMRKPEFGQRATAQTQIDIQSDLKPFMQAFATPDVAIGSFAREAFHQLGSKIFSDFIIELNNHVPIFKSKDQLLLDLKASVEREFAEDGSRERVPDDKSQKRIPAVSAIEEFNLLTERRNKLTAKIRAMESRITGTETGARALAREYHAIKERVNRIDADLMRIERLTPNYFLSLFKQASDAVASDGDELMITVGDQHYTAELDRSTGAFIVREKANPQNIVFDNRVLDENGNVQRVVPLGMAYMRWRIAEHKRINKQMNALLRRYDTLLTKDQRTQNEVTKIRHELEAQEYKIHQLDMKINAGVREQLAYADSELLRIKGAVTALNTMFGRFASQNVQLYNTTEIGGHVSAVVADMRNKIKAIEAQLREYNKKYSAGEDVFSGLKKNFIQNIKALADEWNQTGRPLMMVLSFLDPAGFDSAVIKELSKELRVELAAGTLDTSLERGDSVAVRLHVQLNNIEKKIARLKDPQRRLLLKAQIASLRDRIADGYIRSISLDRYNNLVVEQITPEQVYTQWQMALAQAQAFNDPGLVKRVQELEPLIKENLILGVDIVTDTSGNPHLHVDRISQNVTLVDNPRALRMVMSTIEKFFSKDEMDIVRKPLDRYLDALRSYSSAKSVAERERLLAVISQSYEDFIASISGLSPQTMVFVKDIAGLGKELETVGKQYQRTVHKYLSGITAKLNKEIRDSAGDVASFVRQHYRRDTAAGMTATVTAMAGAVREVAQNQTAYALLLDETNTSDVAVSLRAFLNKLSDDQRKQYDDLMNTVISKMEQLQELSKNGMNSAVASQRITEEYRLTDAKIREMKKRLDNIRKAAAKLPGNNAQQNLLALIDQYRQLVDMRKVTDVTIDANGKVVVNLSPDFYNTVRDLSNSLAAATKNTLLKPLKINEAELVDPIISTLLTKHLNKVRAYAERVYGASIKIANANPADDPVLVSMAKTMLMPLLISRPDIRVLYYYAFTSDFGTARLELEGFDKPPYTQQQINNAMKVIGETAAATSKRAAAYIAEEAIKLSESRMKFADVDTIVNNLIQRLSAVPTEGTAAERAGIMLENAEETISKLSNAMLMIEREFAGDSVSHLRKLLPAFEKLEALNQKNIAKSNQLTIYRLARDEVQEEWRRVYGAATPSMAERKLMGQLIKAEFALKELQMLQERLDKLAERYKENRSRKKTFEKEIMSLIGERQYVEHMLMRYRDSRNRIMNLLNNPKHPVLIGQLGKLHFDEAIANAINKEVVRGNIGAFNDAYATINSLNVLFKGFQASADVSFLAITGLLSLYAYPHLSAAMLRNIMKQLKDPDMYYTYITRFNQKAKAYHLPTADQWVTAYGLHFSHGDLPGQELSKIERPTSLIGKAAEKSTELPVTRQVIGFSSAAYSRMGNMLRLEIANSLVPVYTNPGMSRGEYQSALRQIAKEVNLLTGFSDRIFGDIGGPTGQIAQLTLFAARWFSSQFEIIGDALTKWRGPRGAVAREALFKLIAYGSLLTFAANDILDQETVVDPTDPNFMRVRFGEHDISLFGPWDSLLRGIVRGAQGDPTYMFESRLSPVASIVLDITREISTGTTGDEKYGGPESVLDSWYWLQRVLPFSVSQLLEETQRIDDPDRDWKKNLLSGAVAFLSSITGLKATPLSSYERYREMMLADGVDIEDPLQVRLWKQNNIDRLTAIDAKTTIEYIELRNQYLRRKDEIDELFKMGGMTIDEWYDRIKVINEEWATVAAHEFGDGGGPQNEKQKMIDAYRRINEETFKTGIADFDLRNKMLAEFIATYGLDGLTYVETFMLAGKSEIEQHRSIGVYYLSRVMIDGQTVNYFDMPKMDPAKMVGRPNDLSVTEYDALLANLRQWASNYRADRTYLKDVPVTAAVRDNITQLLDLYGGGSENWTSQEIQRLLIDVTNYGKEAYSNKLIDRIRKEYPYFTRLFDTNATWSIIQDKITPREQAILNEYLGRLGTVDNSE